MFGSTTARSAWAKWWVNRRNSRAQVLDADKVSWIGTAPFRRLTFREPNAVIRAVIFDLDNTLTDFMKMKRAAIDAAVDGMIDAGLKLSREEASARIYRVYD